MTFAGIPLWLLGCAALVPAAVFAFIHPREDASGARAWLLRWAHPLGWVLLSTACFAGILVSGTAAYYTALAGLASFLGFFGALSTGERKQVPPPV
ncbi:hypothetical protein [Actinokineospora sp. HUAS TT18]|uniref:hypothetical protein n=1 Tax=Actinokineospora sp. HUAS TT18 TaxID=3447451 RepID=UPI003F52353B